MNTLEEFKRYLGEAAADLTEQQIAELYEDYKLAMEEEYANENG